MIFGFLQRILNLTVCFCKCKLSLKCYDYVTVDAISPLAKQPIPLTLFLLPPHSIVHFSPKRRCVAESSHKAKPQRPRGVAKSPPPSMYQNPNPPQHFSLCWFRPPHPESSTEPSSSACEKSNPLRNNSDVQHPEEIFLCHSTPISRILAETILPNSSQPRFVHPPLRHIRQQSAAGNPPLW